jgi:hypothetical protein
MVDTLPDTNDADLYERTKLLLDESTIVFEQYLANIDKINTKLLALFQIFLVLVTIQITIIGFKVSLGFFSLSYLTNFLLILNIEIIIATFAVFYYLIWPKSYMHLEISEQERFDALRAASKQVIVDDFLYHIRKSHLANEDNYKKLSLGIRIVLILIATYLILFVCFIVSYLI